MGYREFEDDAGRIWRVWDTRPVSANALRSVSPTFAEGWLTFESDTERRRLAPIPTEWEAASPDLMVNWCGRAVQVRWDPGKRNENERLRNSAG
ncbi:MAG TPA: hypothetical protein VFU01_08400 [Gemmatimonadaceae bacterium]|nr:hypothetical protein [Gemmatimonadaceae bacterium]